MDAYASVEDLEARWKVLDTDEQAKAETLLGDASVHLRTLINQKLGADYQPDDLMTENLKVVCCNVVMRSMNQRPAFSGLSQYTQTAGMYSESFTPINSSGDMRLTTEERKLLGLDGCVAGFVFPWKKTDDQNGEQNAGADN